MLPPSSIRTGREERTVYAEKGILAKPSVIRLTTRHWKNMPDKGKAIAAQHSKSH